MGGSVTDRLPVRRALVSVWDKQGLVGFARRLAACGVELISSGGTAAALRDADVAVTQVAEVTGSPEMLGGRVKTLHPAIHGAILADRGVDAHRVDLAELGIPPIDLVVANLYPFEDAAGAPDADAAQVVEMIDIGGPAMVRAAAKNHAWVGVVTSPGQYDGVAAAVESGGLDRELRRALAHVAFATTAAYDGAIASWLGGGGELPEALVVALERTGHLRYGENPGQSAAIYRGRGSQPWWHVAVQLQGKQMSFNNYADAEAAWRLVNDLPETSAVVVKHTNPCGAASRPTLDAALQAAWECDPLSAFGGVVAMNRPLDAATASRLGANFVEVVVAPAVAEDARHALAARRNLRVIEAPPPHGSDLDVRRIEDGFLVQGRDRITADPASWKVVSKRQPTDAELDGLAFAWVVAAHAKSNAVVVAAGLAAVGVGAGDQSRVGAAERALARAGDRAVGGVAASDAFFPFRDGLDVLAGAGVSAIAEPGGSRRDEEVVAAANEHDVGLVFTGERHFRH